jgi:hypothetical protein
MRPVLRLLGNCDLTVEGSPVPFKITRKLWYALGLVAIAPHCHIGRNELTEAVWPLSELKSRSVLLFKWRRSLLDALEPYIPDVVITVTEQDVSINTEYIDIDYQQCCNFAKIALSSDDASFVLEAGNAFDFIAEDKVLLISFSSAFLELREQFDAQRKAVLRRAWQAEIYLHPESRADKSNFELRLRMLGDEDAIGEPNLPFKALPEQTPVPTRKSILLKAARRLATFAVIGAIIAVPIILITNKTPPKPQVRVVHGTKVNKPIGDLSNKLLYQLDDPRTKRSAATAICITADNQIIGAGNAILTNGDHQTILVLLTKSGPAQWLVKQTDAEGIKTVPKQIVSTESGRIYVASVLSAGRKNALKLAPGSYLTVNVFDINGQRVFERIHPEAMDGSGLQPISLIKDLKGGIHAFASSARNQTSIAMHVPAGSPNSSPSPLTGFPKAFRITDAISDDNGHLFLLGYLPVKTRAGLRMDWHIQAMNKASNTLWSRDITGAVGTASTPLRGVINAQGDVVAYGPLPSPQKQNGRRMLASLVTLAPSTGDVIFRDCYDAENQNPNFALCCLTIGKAAIIALTTKSPDGSEPFTIHRFGNAATDTALSITLRFLGHKRLDSIISFYINNNGVLTALVQPGKEKSSNAALTYTTMFFGRGVETGDLRTTVPFGYSTRGGGLIAGHYNNAFCIYDFSTLP